MSDNLFVVDSRPWWDLKLPYERGRLSEAHKLCLNRIAALEDSLGIARTYAHDRPWWIIGRRDRERSDHQRVR